MLSGTVASSTFLTVPVHQGPRLSASRATARPDLKTPALAWKWLGSCSIPEQQQVISLLDKNNETSPTNLLKGRGLTPGCSLLVQRCSAPCPPAPGAQ